MSESKSVFTIDDSQLKIEEKVKYYNQTLSSLKEARNLFYLSSYKKYDDFNMILSKLYMYLLENYNKTYDIENKSYIYESMSHILVYPEDNQRISEFNEFLVDKLKEVRGIKK